MDIRQLKYFLTITEEGGVTAASKRLNMSQPPLSNQLKLLEDELGVTLFERKNKRLLLTSDGHLLYKHAKNLVADFDHTMQIFEDIRDGISGTLSIGCICSPAIMFLPTFMKGFMEKNPHLNLQVYEGNSNELLELLDNGKIDMCIVKEVFDKNSCESISLDSLLGLSTDSFTAVALPEFFDSSDPVIRFYELENKPLIIQRKHEQLIKDACSDCHFSPKIICTNEYVMTSLNWCLNGLGIAIMPYSSTRLASLLVNGDKLVTKKLIKPTIETKTLLVWKKNQLLSPTAKKFIDDIQLRRRIMTSFQQE